MANAQEYSKLAVLALILLAAMGARASAQQCPQYSHVTKTVTQGNTIEVTCHCDDGYHNINGACAPSWTRGKWLPAMAVANVFSRCIITWKCGPAPDTTLMRSSDSRLVTTPAQNTRGVCQITDNPKECGTCQPIGGEPAATCQYCVEPAECSNASLGWRTRQALCCE
jgi:hypothetical protein